jgi:hypothetical protein
VVGDSGYDCGLHFPMSALFSEVKSILLTDTLYKAVSQLSSVEELK